MSRQRKPIDIIVNVIPFGMYVSWQRSRFEQSNKVNFHLIANSTANGAFNLLKIAHKYSSVDAEQFRF